MRKNDQFIWESIRKGNVDSLRILHDRYYFQLCSYANMYLQDLSLTEELVSDCFLKLWLHREQIVIQKSLKVYLFFMLKNLVIDNLRKNNKKFILNSKSLPDLPDDEMISKTDSYAELYKAIKKLPEQRRRILELAAFESFSYKEIAQQLNISVNTVKTQMGRAYQFLKEELDPKNFLFFYIYSTCN